MFLTWQEAGASHFFSSPKNIVWYLHLVAFVKLLSPSYDKGSITLHSDNIQFLILKSKSDSAIFKVCRTLVITGFKGFQSNRFKEGWWVVNWCDLSPDTNSEVFFDEIRVSQDLVDFTMLYRFIASFSCTENDYIIDLVSPI